MTGVSQRQHKRQIRKQARARIKRHGWTTISVAGEVAVTYSVGLAQTFAHPEIVVIALPPDLCQQLIATVASLLKSGRRMPESGQSTAVVEGYAVAFVPTSRAFNERNLLLCQDLYGSVPEGLHLIIPDKAGQFPWDAQCDPAHRQLQWPLTDWQDWESYQHAGARGQRNLNA